MQSSERARQQEDLTRLVRAILNEPSTQASRARRRTFESWRKSLSATFHIAVEPRDFGTREQVTFPPLAAVIEDVKDVELIRDKLTELRIATTKPGSVSSSPSAFDGDAESGGL